MFEETPAAAAPAAPTSQPTAIEPQQPVAQPAAPENAETPTQQQDEAQHSSRKFERRIGRLMANNARLQAELDLMKSQPAARQEAAAQPDGMPQRAQFKTDDEFIEAVVDWRADQKIADRDRKQRSESEASEDRRLRMDWEKKVDAAADVYDDFEEVALAQDVPISPTMARVIQGSEKGADIAYYLGKNKAEAAKIARMDPFSQAMALGRIEATVTRPAEKKATEAPAPISPVGARSAAPTKDPEKMTTEEWVKWRNEQLQSRRRKR